MFDRLFSFIKPAKSQPDHLQVGATLVPLLFVRHPRARRYLLRLRADGVARVTIPRRGSISAGRDFAARNIGWLGEQLQRQAAQPKTLTAWQAGTEIYFRGELVRIEPEKPGWIRLGTELIKVADEALDLKPVIQKHLHRLAAKEFPPRVMELAGIHGIK